MPRLRELTAILLALALALAFSQLPRFVEEYQQRLGGALDEARHELVQFQHDAEQAGLSFADYVQRHLENADPVIVATGRTIQSISDRVETLQREDDEIELAAPLLRPVIVLRQADRERLSATWSAFTLMPSFDFSFGAIGLLLGWLINALFWGLTSGRRRRVRV